MKYKPVVNVILITQLLFSYAFCQLNDPCKDSLFIQLKKKSLSDLNQREYDYLMLFQKACIDKSAIPISQTENELCTLIVRINSFKGKNDFDKQDIPSKSIFVDDVFINENECTILLKPGNHFVSLYSKVQLNIKDQNSPNNSSSAKAEVNLFPNEYDNDNNWKLSRMQKTYINVNLMAGASRKLTYSVICNYRNQCSGDEWYYEIK